MSETEQNQQQENQENLNTIPLGESRQFEESNQAAEPQKERVEKIKLAPINRSESVNTPQNAKPTNDSPMINSKGAPQAAKKVYTPQYTSSGMQKSYPHSSTNFGTMSSSNLGQKKNIYDSPYRSSTQKNLTESERFNSGNMFSQNQLNFNGGSSQMTTMSNFMSASTLRHSATSITFPKAERFVMPKLAHSGAQYDLPSMKDPKAPTFGFGEKRILPQYLVKNAQEIPSPAKYATHRSMGQLPTAKSFGLAYSYYAKTYIPKVTIKEPEASRDLPGVGQYEVAKQFAEDKLKYSLYGKGIVFQDLNPSCSPPCNQYSPNEKLIKTSRFSDTTFGHGQKYDFTKVTKVVPGPGTYVMPSAFDRFKNNKYNSHRVTKSVSRQINV